MALFLFLCGAFFGVLLLLNNLLKTIQRAEKISFLELLLTYLTAILLLVGVVVNNLDAFAVDSMPISGELPGGIAFSIPVAPPDPQVEFLTLAAAGALGAFSLFIIVLEIFRPQRLKASRGVFGVFSAAFIALSTVLVPFLGVYFALDADAITDDAPIVADAPTVTTSPPNRVTAPSAVITSAPTATLDPDAPTPTRTFTPDPDATLTPTSDPEARARAVELFQAIRAVLATEIDLPEADIFAQLDAGVPIAQLVTENGGDIEVVISNLTALLRDVIMQSAERGEMNRVQAALFSSQMGTIIRIAVNSDLNTLSERLGGEPPDPAATRASLTDLLTQVPVIEATAPPVLLSNTERADSPTPSAFPTNTRPPTSTDTPIPATLSPTPTRTPPAPPTSTPDRVATLFRELTLTPLASSISATSPPDPLSESERESVPTRDVFAPFCVASVDFNLRLRRAPSQDAETLIVIPYTTVLELTAQNSDGTWFAATYDGQSGWLDAEFLTLAASCANLPYR